MNSPFPTTITEVEFESVSWHDCYFYGFSLRAGEHGTGSLVLDLDFIVEWLSPVEGFFRFRVAPATLTFREVSELRVELSYVDPNAALGPFALDGIEREVVTYPTGWSSYRWVLNVNWPHGYFRFASPGFTQILRAEPLVSNSPRLESSSVRL